MLSRTKTNETANIRMMGLPELCAYIGMGQTNARKFGVDAGAVRKIGRRTLYDRVLIDKALDELPKH